MNRGNRVKRARPGLAGAATVLIGLVAIGLLNPGIAWAQAEIPIRAQQGEFQKAITPVLGSVPAEEFYNYSLADYQSRTPLGVELPRVSLLFFYRETATGKLALIVIHNAPDAGPGGRVRMRIEGLPPSATLTLKDDPNDEYRFDPPTGEFSWRWTSKHTDGLVINNLEGSFTLKVTLEKASGIQQWKLLTINDPAVGVERVPLKSLEEPLTLIVGRGAVAPTPTPAPGGLRAAFVVSPEPARVGVPVLFDARPSQVFQADIVRYEWDFDGDGAFDLTTQEPTATHVYEEPGTFPVTLRITDSGGRTATTTKPLEVIAEQTIVTREISTPEARPGDVFRVTVRIRVEVPSNGLGLEERLPLGWTIEPVRLDGSIFKPLPGRGQWLFPTLLKRGTTKTIVYDVRVPAAEEVSGTLPRRFRIEGDVTSVSPEYTIPVSGESEIALVSCLSAAVAIAHWDLETGFVDLKGGERIAPEQLARALRYWQQDRPIPETCDTRLDPETLPGVLTHVLLDIPVDESLPKPIDDPRLVPFAVTRAIETPLPGGRLFPTAERGNAFQVRLTITALRDLPGVRIQERLPEGWEVRVTVPAGVLYKPATHEWLIPELIQAGETRTLAYEVLLPERAAEAPGPYSLTGVAESGLLTFLYEIPGDRTVEVLQCLPVLLAIAHLDPETGRIDLTLDDRVTREQANAAFRLWLEDEEVPGTCGRKLSIRVLQRAISLMVTGKPVEE